MKKKPKLLSNKKFLECKCHQVQPKNLHSNSNVINQALSISKFTSSIALSMVIHSISNLHISVWNLFDRQKCSNRAMNHRWDFCCFFSSLFNFICKNLFNIHDNKQKIKSYSNSIHRRHFDLKLFDRIENPWLVVCLMSVFCVHHVLCWIYVIGRTMDNCFVIELDYGDWQIWLDRCNLDLPNVYSYFCTGLNIWWFSYVNNFYQFAYLSNAPCLNFYRLRNRSFSNWPLKIWNVHAN